MSHPSLHPKLDLHHPVHRRAVRTAAAILLATGVIYLLKPPHGEWITLSAFLVSQDTVGSSLWKAKGRIMGAVLGAIASLMLYALLRQDHTLIFIAAFLTIFPYVYLVTALNSYHYAFFFLQVAYVCFLAAVGKHPSVELIEWRVVCIAIGITLGLIVALLVLPTSARPRLQQRQIRAWHDLHHWFNAIVAELQSAPIQSSAIDRQMLERLSRSAQRNVFRLEEDLASRKHELIGKPEAGFNGTLLRQKDSEFIQAYRPIYRSLLYLSHIVQLVEPSSRSAELPEEIKEMIEQLTIAFEELGQAIHTHSQITLPPVGKADPGSSVYVNAQENCTADALNIALQLNSVYAAIASYSNARNEFLWMLAGHSPKI